MPLGEAFVCPACGRGLKPPPVAGRFLGLLPLLAACGVVAGIGAGMFGAARLTCPVPPAEAVRVAALPPPAPPPVVVAPKPKPVVLPPPIPVKPVIIDRTVLRLAGASAAGGDLAALLARDFLAASGDTAVTILPGGARVTGLHGTARDIITISRHGASAAFADLARGTADAALAARRIRPEETAQAGGAAPDERLIALDGVAVIVNAGNPVATLSREQLRGIFSGALTDWSQLGGPPGAIDVFARDDEAGVFDTVAALVLRGAALSPAAHRIADGRALAAEVAAEVSAIGFIGLPYAPAARLVAVGEAGGTPLLPNRVSLGTEDYPLTQRLYLYAAPGNDAARRFAEFASSPAGQAAVEKAGLVPLTIDAAAAALPESAPPRTRADLAEALRLTTNVRFAPNGIDFDARALRDFDQLAGFLAARHDAGAHLIVAGFSDNAGPPGMPLAMARRRAQSVAAALALRGVKPGKILAYGADMPVADNATDDGRDRNRRVELYYQP